MPLEKIEATKSSRQNSKLASFKDFIKTVWPQADCLFVPMGTVSRSSVLIWVHWVLSVWPETENDR